MTWLGLDEAVILVTGGCGSIGKAIAAELVAHGAAVIVADRSEVSPEAVESARHSASRLGVQAGSRLKFVVGDATTVGTSGYPAPDLVVINPPRRGIGRGFQNNALFSGMSVLDNVIAGLSRHARVTLVEEAFRLPRARGQERAFRDRAHDVLKLFDLEKHAGTIVGTLPYGVQKKVEIARAIVAQPRLLLLDEPLAGMNAAEKQEIAAVIARLNRDLDLTIVLIEHDIGIVLKLAHHVVVLDYGRKLADGPPETIRDNPDVIAAYLGAGHAEAAA